MNEHKVSAAVERSQAEIRADIADGTLPEHPGSFSELHDYVDANEYGGLCDDGADFTIEEANEIQTRVDAWLRSPLPGDDDYAEPVEIDSIDLANRPDLRVYEEDES